MERKPENDLHMYNMYMYAAPYTVHDYMIQYTVMYM